MSNAKATTPTQADVIRPSPRRIKRKKGFKRTLALDLMLLPAVILTFIFAYIPMGGLVIAFQDYKPWLGFAKSSWIGLEHFQFLFSIPENVQVIWNTLIIAGMKLIGGLIAPLIFALLLNEVRKETLKKSIQTFVYLPHFLSWVILGGILLDMLATKGMINQFLGAVFGLEPIFFLGEGTWFRIVVVTSDIWKEFGFGAIIFLASLAGINPSLYEAAEVDGASRWQQTWSITIPALIPIMIVVGTLSLGNILNGGFDQIFNLYNPLVYDKGDIIDTFVYRIGLIDGKFGFSAAVGLFKSVVGFVLIVLAYRTAYKFANYRIF
ncbi:putative aldouronate transport system permease protein [Paenibacillus intestini]|nr:putative aldouronate transport system permease protein [Paenibacillus intestini]